MREITLVEAIHEAIREEIWQWSLDNTSVGRKCLRANVLLPEPLGPTRTTSDKLGSEQFI